MERDMLDPSNAKASHTHPLYALAMKQLAEYRAVAKNPDRKRQSMAPSPYPNIINNTGMSGAPGVAMAALATKKARVELTTAASSLLASTGQGLGTLPVAQRQSQTAESILTQVLISLKRIEAVAYNTGPPKLPSPLFELHRILVGGMLDDPSNYQILTPYYNKCLAAFLRVVQQQADNATTPGLLPGVLEGLELLMRHDGHDVDIKKGLQYTYNYVLKIYLKLIEPQVQLSGQSTHGVADEAVI